MALWAALALATGVGANARAATSPNLIVNGNAEAQRCTADWTAQTTVPGWRVLRGAASVLCYSAFKWTGETPALPTGEPSGAALFAAPGADTAMEQRVDVSATARAIDRGEVGFDLSAWLGGVGTRPERATLTAVFLDDDGHATGDPIVIGDVDAEARAFKTGLVARDRQGKVPRHTRAIVVSVDFISGPTSFSNAFADNIELRLSGDVSALQAVAATPPKAAVPSLDHVFMLMMENTNYADVVGVRNGKPVISAEMPYLASIAPQGVIATNFWGTYHPSDQNYIAMVAGDTFKLGPVYFPDFDLPQNHIGDLLEAKGLSWRGYVQGMKTPCDLQSGPTWDPNYAPDDEPFANFANVISNATRCKASLLDLTDFTASISSHTLPNFAWLAADGFNDGEGAWYLDYSVPYSLAVQDAFLKSTLAPLLRSTAWTNSRTLVAIVWDEADGWAWPDNHVPLILIGSPGLLREGTSYDAHVGGYDLLRTAELALGVPDLGRFDTFATPLNGIFAGLQGHADRDADRELQPDRNAATRGSVADTFGQGAVPASVDQGQSLVLHAPAWFDPDSVVNIEPLGTTPTKDSVPYRIDAAGTVSLPTSGLAPGFYGVWLRHAGQPPDRAFVPAIVLPPAAVSTGNPGVEILGASLDSSTKMSPPLQVKEGANFFVRYCGDAASTPANSWIGIFPEGTKVAEMTKANANALNGGSGDWLYAPDVGAGSRCGEAEAYPAELAVGVNYQVYLFRQDDKGVSTPIGASAAFRLKSALPH